MLRHLLWGFGLLSLLAMLTITGAPSEIAGQDSRFSQFASVEESTEQSLQPKSDNISRSTISVELIDSDKVEFGTMVGNLKDERASRYWRLSIVLKSNPADQKKLAELYAQKRAELRHELLLIMCDESIASFSGSSGATKVREKLHKAFSEILQPNEKSTILKEVLFTEMTIQ